MAQDGRPLIFGHQLGLVADQAVRQGTQLFDQPGIVHARAKVEGRLRSRVGGGAASGGLETHVAHVQAIVQLPGGLASQVDERGILGPSLPGVAKLLETRRIRIDDLDRAQLSAEPGRDPAGLEPVTRHNVSREIAT